MGPRKYVKTIVHSDSHLPEMIINEGFSNFKTFCNYFTTNSSTTNKSFTTSSTKMSSQYEIGMEIQYIKDDHTELATITSITTNNNSPTIYTLRLASTEQIVETTQDFMKSLEEQELTQFPSTTSDIKEIISQLSKDDLLQLLNFQHSTLQQEFLTLHEHLNHLSFKDMFQLIEHGKLPEKFKNLKYKTNMICPSCIFGKMKRRSWRSKAPPKSIINPLLLKPGSQVSIDQVISKQPGLVPRMEGGNTRDRIFSATVYINHFSKFSYSHLQ